LTTEVDTHGPPPSADAPAFVASSLDSLLLFSFSLLLSFFFSDYKTTLLLMGGDGKVKKKMKRKDHCRNVNERGHHTQLSLRQLVRAFVRGLL